MGRISLLNAHLEGQTPPGEQVAEGGAHMHGSGHTTACEFCVLSREQPGSSDKATKDMPEATILYTLTRTPWTGLTLQQA